MQSEETRTPVEGHAEWTARRVGCESVLKTTASARCHEVPQGPNPQIEIQAWMPHHKIIVSRGSASAATDRRDTS